MNNGPIPQDAGVTSPLDVLPATLPSLRLGSVVLRRFFETDASVVREASADPLIPLITTVPTAPSDEEVAAYITRQQSRRTDGIGYSFAIADADSNAAVGQIGLWLHDFRFGRVSVGYWVAPSARRRRYATTAIMCVTEWGFSLPGVARVELYVEPSNEPSWRAAEAAGFYREGLLRSWQAVGTERRDMFMYARLNEQRTSAST